MATYGDVLRSQNQASGLRRRADTLQRGLRPPKDFAYGGGQIEQMGGMTAPAPVGIDWGNVIRAGVEPYMAGRADKEADKAEADRDEVSRLFMEDTLKNDQESLRLFQMAQMGMPGADQALAQRIAPKKQPLATFTQFVAQNPDLDDESAIAFGAESGLSPELSKGIVAAARRGSASSKQEALDKEERVFGRALEMEAFRTANRMAAKGGDSLTPGQQQLRGKMMQTADQELMDLGQSTGKFDEMMQTIERDQLFGSENKVAQFLSESPNRLIAAAGRSQLSEGSLMLKEYMNSKVLTRMKQLGGNDSNEELRNITASLPDAMNNKEAAMAMLKKLHDWEETVRLATKLRRDDIQAGTWFSRTPSREDYWSRAKQMRAGGQTGNPQPAQQAPINNVPTQGGLPDPSELERLLDEEGF